MIVLLTASVKKTTAQCREKLKKDSAEPQPLHNKSKLLVHYEEYSALKFSQSYLSAVRRLASCDKIFFRPGLTL